MIHPLNLKLCHSDKLTNVVKSRIAFYQIKDGDEYDDVDNNADDSEQYDDDDIDDDEDEEQEEDVDDIDDDEDVDRQL